MTRMPILTYHSIDRTGSVLSTTPERFRAQVEFLARRGFRTLSLSEALAGLRERPAPGPRVVICFDDAFESVHRIAWPLLRDHGLAATVFAVSGYCGRTNDWPGQPPSIPRLPLMTTDQLAELGAASWQVAAHSASHPDLTRVGDGQLEAELGGCRAELEAATGSRVRWFAYPYGAHDARVRAAAGRHFEGACGTELGFATAGGDPLALARLDTYYLRPPGFFEGLESGWLAGYLQVRHWIRSARGK